jgi:type VI protein secretion system component VasA
MSVRFNSLTANVLHICDGRAFELKCSLGKRINQLLKSRQTETNCTPIANVLLLAAKVQRPILVSARKAEFNFVAKKLNL